MHLWPGIFASIVKTRREAKLLQSGRQNKREHAARRNRSRSGQMAKLWETLIYD